MIVARGPGTGLGHRTLVLILLFVVLVIGGVAYMVTTPEDRTRAVAAAHVHLQPWYAERELCNVATAPFREALRARTPWAIVTPTIVGINAAVFIFMLFGSGALSAPTTLVAWGANLGWRTTNGEWWRVVTATFVHGGILHLLATFAGLAQLGRMVERLVGPVTFACVYIIAGTLANLVTISEMPLVVDGGATGAIFGIYGLLLAATLWSQTRRTGIAIPMMAFRSLAPTAAIFLLYTFATDGLASRPNLTGLVVGLAIGLVLTRDVGERQAELRPTAMAVAVSAVVMVAVAWPLRGYVDVGPQIAEVVAIEDRTIGPYKSAVDRFRKGRLGVRALTDLIGETIMPQLQEARVRIEALDDVGVEHQPLVADAEEFLKLREKSWQLRIDALKAGSMQALREADSAERVSLEALEKLRRKQRDLDASTKSRSVAGG